LSVGLGVEAAKVESVNFIEDPAPGEARFEKRELVMPFRAFEIRTVKITPRG
jgi:hypothetical protein